MAAALRELADARAQLFVALLLLPIALRSARLRLDVVQAARRAEIGLPAFEEVARMIDRHAEVQSLGVLVAQGRDADHRSVAIEHRAAAVSGVGRRVGLHQRGAAARAQAADDASRDAVLQRAERRSNDDDFLAGPERLRAAHRNHACDAEGVATLRIAMSNAGARDLDARVQRDAIALAQRHIAVVLHDVHVGDQRVVADEEAAAASARGFDQHDRRHHAIDHLFGRRGGGVGPAAAPPVLRLRPAAAVPHPSSCGGGVPRARFR